MSKSNDKSRVLGDDPLAWLNAGTGADKKTDKKTDKNESMVKNKKNKKPKSEKKIKVDKVETEKPKSERPKDDETKADKKEKINRLELESSLVINKASEVYALLEKLSVNGGAVEIDASKVEVIDSAILQLLLAFVLSLKEKGISLSWHKPSEGMLSKASILGLTEQLGL